MAIRRATMEDIEKICGFFKEVYEENYSKNYDEEWMEELLRDEDNSIFLVEENEKILAVNSVASYSEGLSKLGRFVYSKDVDLKVYPKFLQELMEQTKESKFCLAEANIFEKKIQESFLAAGWKAAGFLPIKYQLKNQEHSTCFILPHKELFENRKCRPCIIEEIKPLVENILKKFSIEDEIAVDIGNEGYPMGGTNSYVFSVKKSAILKKILYTKNILENYAGRKK